MMPVPDEFGPSKAPMINQDLDECNIVFCLLSILEDFSSVFNTTAHDYSIAAAIVTGFD